MNKKKEERRKFLPITQLPITHYPFPIPHYMVTNLLKFILGFALAIAVLLGTGLTVALYFVNRTAVTPPKPMYANDNPSSQAKKPKAIPKSQPKKQATPNPTSSPTPTPTESPKPLPPDAYEGTVTWAAGLSMRSEPDGKFSQYRWSWR